MCEQSLSSALTLCLVVLCCPLPLVCQSALTWSIQHGEIDDDVLRFCSHKLARQYNMAARLPVFAPDLTRQRKQPSKSSGGRIALRPISEHLYDGTGVYEGASFIVKPEIRTFLGRRLRILQLGHSRSLEQFEADFESRYSKVILSGDEEGYDLAL
jgi:hypothetical protein